MIRNLISSDIETLNNLNIKYKWLPNSETIRPNSLNITHKHYRLNQIANEWESIDDYIRYRIFGQKAYINSQNKKQIKNPSLDLPKIIFAESEFKYDLIPESNHWVLWLSNLRQDENLNDVLINEINEIITNQLAKLIKLLKSDNFDFAWYKNPKPTINEFFHVQVFWICWLG
jgi:hypothetical protein